MVLLPTAVSVGDRIRSITVLVSSTLRLRKGLATQQPQLPFRQKFDPSVLCPNPASPRVAFPSHRSAAFLNINLITMVETGVTDIQMHAQDHYRFPLLDITNGLKVIFGQKMLKISYEAYYFTTTLILLTY